MLQVTCCKDCDKRIVGCHAKCDNYQTEKANYIAVISKMNKARYQSNIVGSVQYNSIKELLRKRGKG